MAEYHTVDITNLAILGEQFPLRLMQLGFRMIQLIDEQERDQSRYVIPPICDVPAGPFLMGSDKDHDPGAAENELPQHEVFVSTFQIAMYPVTVAEYMCAVEAGAVSVPQQGFHAHMTWQDQQRHPDHPVMCITWQEARAYAAWLAIVTRQPWRLPTEVEWEKAARGTDGRIYPWGNEWDKARANTKESGPATTTPVGGYAREQDASPYGAHDMAGNVWEWASSIYHESLPYRRDLAENDTDTTSARVMRGGSWFAPCKNARATYRGSKLRPDLYNISGGVRLVLSARSP
jgi:formylglycine-generating enzyme required for sulfatase activity